MKYYLFGNYKLKVESNIEVETVIRSAPKFRKFYTIKRLYI